MLIVRNLKIRKGNCLYIPPAIKTKYVAVKLSKESLSSTFITKVPKTKIRLVKIPSYVLKKIGAGVGSMVRAEFVGYNYNLASFRRCIIVSTTLPEHWVDAIISKSNRIILQDAIFDAVLHYLTCEHVNEYECYRYKKIPSFTVQGRDPMYLERVLEVSSCEDLC